MYLWSGNIRSVLYGRGNYRDNNSEVFSYAKSRGAREMSEKEKEEFARLCDIAEALIETLEDIRKRQKIPKAGVQKK